MLADRCVGLDAPDSDRDARVRTHKSASGVQFGMIQAPKQRGRDERAFLADKRADGAAEAVLPEIEGQAEGR